MVNKRILVTGGLGYIGSRLSLKLLQCQCDVVLTDYMKSSQVPFVLNACKVINFDLTDEDLIDKACQNVDVIIHLAALNAQECTKDPKSAHLINAKGTLKLLKAAIKYGVEHFIYMSTAHVYKSPLDGFIDENTIPHPEHPYSITHKLAEEYVFEATCNSNLKGTVFRLSNAMGSPLHPSANCWMLAINNLALQAIDQNELIFHSSPYTERDFLPLTDVCDVLSKAATNAEFGEQFSLYNLGSGQTLNLKDIAVLLVTVSEEVLGKKLEVNFPHHENKEFDHLRYSNKKLLDAGFNIQYDILNETRQLLHNCNKWKEQKCL